MLVAPPSTLRLDMSTFGILFNDFNNIPTPGMLWIQERLLQYDTCSSPGYAKHGASYIHVPIRCTRPVNAGTKQRLKLSFTFKANSSDWAELSYSKFVPKPLDYRTSCKHAAFNSILPHDAHIRLRVVIMPLSLCINSSPVFYQQKASGSIGVLHIAFQNNSAQTRRIAGLRLRLQ